MTMDSNTGQQQQVQDQQGQQQQQQQVVQTTPPTQQQTQQAVSDLGISKEQLQKWGIHTPEQLKDFIEQTPKVYAALDDLTKKTKQTKTQQQHQQQVDATQRKRAMIIKQALEEHKAAGGDEADFLAAFSEVIEQNAVARAAEITEQKLSKREQTAANNRRAHDEFWENPANKDLKESYWTMMDLVSNRGMKPDEAADFVRMHGIKDNEKVRPKNYGGAGLGSAHYEGVAKPPEDTGKGGIVPDEVRKRVSAYLSKPAKERSSAEIDAAFGW